MAIADQRESRTQHAGPARKDRRTGTGHGAVGYGCRHGRETAWAPVAGGSARDQGDATGKVDANALLTGLCAAAHRPDENGERSVPIVKKWISEKERRRRRQRCVLVWGGARRASLVRWARLSITRHSEVTRSRSSGAAAARGRAYAAA